MNYSKILRNASLSVLASALIAYAAARSLPVTVTIPVRPPEPAENAFLPLTAAASRIIDHEKITDARVTQPGKKQWTLAEKRALIEKNCDIVAFARQAIRLPYRETNTVTSMDDDSRSYRSLRNLTRLLVLAGDVAWECGDRSEATDCYLDAVRLGRNIPKRTGMLGLMAGQSCELIGRNHLWKRLDELDANTAERCLKRLNDLADKRLPLYVAFEEEKYSALSIAMDSMSDAKPTSHAAFFPKRYVADTLGGYMDKQIALTKKPYSPSDKEIPHPKEIFTAILAPAEKPVRCKYAATEAGDILLRTALAVHIFKEQNGKLPRELSELVTAGLLPTIPNDPFAPSETPVRYSLTSDGKPQIYSVGPDGIDDGGKGIEVKGTNGKMTRVVKTESKGDMVAGWHPY